VTTFVLVHGAFHGAWCWQPLIEHLTASGHATIAIDLPIDDERAGWQDHVDAVLDGVPESPQSILVGHSRAGRLIPLLLERRHFDAVVYIATSLPDPLDEPARQCDSIPMLLPAPITLTRDESGRVVCPTERAVALYYHDCSPELRDWAVARLRPQFDIAYPLPDTRTPLPSLYLAGVDDRAVNIDWMRAAAKEILGQPAVELQSGHCPFLSATTELAKTLAAFANEQPVSSNDSEIA
jgi:pimeloyl-ACP methyl ester carboxylesterase